MKKVKLLAILMAAAMLTLSACNSSDNTSDGGTTTDTNDNQTGIDTAQEDNTQDTTPMLTSAVDMREQGNMTRIQLADIMETSGDAYAAWIKISTQFDPELSMYSYDTMPAGTIAIIVDFTVSHFDESEATLYWGYQLISNGTSQSVWDGTSAADTLMITEDGSYTIVFDAQKALGGPIDSIESFQLVFPSQSETPATEVSVTRVRCLTDENDLQYVSSGRTE